MNKSDFIRSIANKGGMTMKEAENAYSAFVDSVVEGLKADKKIALVGFGTFELKHKEASIKRNPATGADINVPACNVPSLKIGKSFKDLFN